MSVEQIPPATTPVSGTVTANAGTNLNTSALALSATQTSGAQKTQVVDGGGNVIGATANALDVNIKSGNPTTITVTQGTGTNLHTVVDSGTITTVSSVTAIAGALPAGTNLLGSVYDEPDDTWHQTHVPAANTQATISQTAGAGSLKNVCTGFTVTVCGGATAPAAFQGTVALIDGATGGTTYLWRSNITIPATAGSTVSFTHAKGKWTGSAATAMTLEFSGAFGANTLQSVTMKGYTK